MNRSVDRFFSDGENNNIKEAKKSSYFSITLTHFALLIMKTVKDSFRNLGKQNSILSSSIFACENCYLST